MSLKAKIPPQAIDVETVVLGAALIDVKGADEMFSVFTNAEVFYTVQHQKIFTAIKQLYNASQPIDILTVSEKLKELGDLKDAGGDFYMIGLTQKVSSSAHQEFHCRILLQKYISRKVIELCNSGIEMAYDDKVDVFDLTDYVTTQFDKLTDITNIGHNSMTWSDAILSIPNRVEFLTNNQGKVTGVPTGLKATDKHFNGWQPQDLIIIGADSGMGKTALVLGNMLAVAKEGLPVGMFSMEMSVVQLAIRGVATQSNYHMNQLMRNGFEKAEYFDGLNKVVNEMQSYPIHIDDQPALTVPEMKRKARQLYRKHGIKMLVVDFVQMFSGDKDVRINISEAARELNNIAKELNIPVIALSQLSREVRRVQYSIPSKHHLKESSAIEEAADVIALLYRPTYYGFKRETHPDLYNGLYMDDYNTNATLIVAKNRNGALGNVGLHFIENKTKYINPSDVSMEMITEDDNDIAF